MTDQSALGKELLKSQGYFIMHSDVLSEEILIRRERTQTPAELSHLAMYTVREALDLSSLPPDDLRATHVIVKGFKGETGGVEVLKEEDPETGPSGILGTKNHPVAHRQRGGLKSSSVICRLYNGHPRIIGKLYRLDGNPVFLASIYQWNRREDGDRIEAIILDSMAIDHMREVVETIYWKDGVKVKAAPVSVIVEDDESGVEKTEVSGQKMYHIPARLFRTVKTDLKEPYELPDTFIE